MFNLNYAFGRRGTATLIVSGAALLSGPAAGFSYATILYNHMCVKSTCGGASVSCLPPGEHAVCYWCETDATESTYCVPYPGLSCNSPGYSVCAPTRLKGECKEGVGAGGSCEGTRPDSNPCVVAGHSGDCP